MKGSRKGPTPPKLLAWLNKAGPDWQPDYPFDSSEVRDEVRSGLLAEQRGLCVYCGRRLDLARAGETYHVEHFRPRRHYKPLSTTYANLFLSCGQKDEHGKPSKTCGAVKADWFDEDQHVAPDYPQCTHRFRFMLSGKIEPQVADDVGALNMIKNLRLDHPELNKDRGDVLMMIDGGDLDETDFWEPEGRFAQNYAHLVFQHLGKLLP
ncbi:TIGR02646 family protein [Rhizobium leguminosarum]|uniref:TIGR02646 family protein n=1 Tax=Rhizobium ruizarguesonis TaxID=2081791 RepID=A0AAE4YSW5_9HYPH|nr:retron system putative HNH endonuclease [Rhizobium ruizarguesonis]NEI50530.1 TIGR02646 family protein [Rhizobium ruizarguesonis]